MAFADILKDAGLSDDEIAVTMGSFSTDPRVVKAVEASTMRQSDYSRKQDEVANYRKQIEVSWQAANNKFLEMQSSYSATQAEKDAATAKLAEVEAKLATAQTIDTSKIVTPEQLQEQMRMAAAGQTAYLGEIADIADQHRELFGKSISQKTLMQDSMAAKKSPAEYWEEKYQVQTKRDELAKAADDLRIENIRKEERVKLTAEFLNPATRPMRDSDQAFYVPSTDGAAKNPWDEIGPSPEEIALTSELANAGR